MNDLYRALMQAFNLSAPFATAATLAFLRVSAAMVFLPGLGEHGIPARLRLGLSILLTLAITPAISDRLQSLSIAPSFLPEIVIGLIIGLALRFFIFALSTAGSIIANSTSLSQLFAQGGDPQPAISQFLVMAGIALALQADLLPRLISYLLMSYDMFPPGRLPVAGELAEWALRHADMAFALGFGIALPFAIGSLLYNLALGVINRAMPQLMVTFIGAPALSLGGLALLALVTPVLLSVWWRAFSGFLDTAITP